MGRELVATWKVTTREGIRTVEFEHGTTTGKRIVWVDGVEVVKKEWMFKLVGTQEFQIDSSTPAIIYITSSSGWAFQYSLEVNGKPLEKHHQRQSRIARCWCPDLGAAGVVRVVLERDTLDVWCNGEVMETESQFVDGGSEIVFDVSPGKKAVIRAISSGNRREGLVHVLFVDGIQVVECSQ